MPQRLLIQAIIFTVFLLAGCQSASETRVHTARALALQSHMQEQNIKADPFILRSYERVDDKSANFIRIYIEGDGFAWVNQHTPSLDPTPKNPTALKLAQSDNAPNVIYLARPCQYNLTLINGDTCPDKYWTGARFAPEVVAATNAAIDDIITRYNIHRVELVGFSGGSAIAALVAAGRTDILNIRGVAGNIDTDLFTRLHQVSPLDESLNPVNVAPALHSIPQIYMTGENDTIVPEEIFKSFKKASGISACLKHVIVPGTTHNDWATKWSDLLKIPFSCDRTL